MNETSNDIERLIREFVEGKLTADQLACELRRCAERPDLGLRAFMTMPIDWQQVPEERLFKVVQTVTAITGPVLASFFSGEVSVQEAATQIAPYFLMWGAPARARRRWRRLAWSGARE